MSRVFAQVMVPAMGLIIVLAPQDMVIAIVNTLPVMESFKQILRFAMDMAIVLLPIISHVHLDTVREKIVRLLYFNDLLGDFYLFGRFI